MRNSTNQRQDGHDGSSSRINRNNRQYVLKKHRKVQTYLPDKPPNTSTSRCKSGQVSSSDDSSMEEFSDGYDGQLMGDCDDRINLNSMTEFAREMELYDRGERREGMKSRFEIEKRMRKAKRRQIKSQATSLRGMPKLYPLTLRDDFEFITENVYKKSEIRIKGKKGDGEENWMQCDCVEPTAGLGCLENCHNRAMFIECGRDCKLGEKCTNRMFNKKKYCQAEVFSTEKKGFGLRTLQHLSMGDFVSEYIGEILNAKEFNQRIDEYAISGQTNFYFMTLTAELTIDAGPKGNNSRYINHSCAPNCKTEKWTMADTGETRVGIFANREVNIGEELTFDYRQENYGDRGQECFCDAPSCRGVIREQHAGNPIFVDLEHDPTVYEPDSESPPVLLPQLTINTHEPKPNPNPTKLATRKDANRIDSNKPPIRRKRYKKPSRFSTECVGVGAGKDETFTHKKYDLIKQRRHTFIDLTKDEQISIAGGGQKLSQLYDIEDIEKSCRVRHLSVLMPLRVDLHHDDGDSSVHVKGSDLRLLHYMKNRISLIPSQKLPSVSIASGPKVNDKDDQVAITSHEARETSPLKQTEVENRIQPVKVIYQSPSIPLMASSSSGTEDEDMGKDMSNVNQVASSIKSPQHVTTNSEELAETQINTKKDLHEHEHKNELNKCDSLGAEADEKDGDVQIISYIQTQKSSHKENGLQSVLSNSSTDEDKRISCTDLKRKIDNKYTAKKDTSLVHDDSEEGNDENKETSNVTASALYVHELKKVKLDENRQNLSSPRPFPCHLCGAGFLTPQGLQRHLQSSKHSAPKYKCPICLAKLSRSDYIPAHIKQFHSNTSKTKRDLLQERRKLLEVSDDTQTMDKSLRHKYLQQNPIQTPTTIPSYKEAFEALRHAYSVLDKFYPDSISNEMLANIRQQQPHPSSSFCPLLPVGVDTALTASPIDKVHMTTESEKSEPQNATGNMLN